MPEVRFEIVRLIPRPSHLFAVVFHTPNHAIALLNMKSEKGPAVHRARH